MRRPGPALSKNQSLKTTSRPSEASGTDLFHLLRYSLIKICKVLGRRIIAIKARHPFIMRKAHRRGIALELPSESGLADTKIAMNQMSSRHKKTTPK